MKNLKLLIGCLMLAFTPALSGMAVRPDEWYNSLQKSALNPPGWVFAPVWTVLYATMGISHYRYCVAETATDKTAGNLVYALQLLLNGTWSLVFFGARAAPRFPQHRAARDCHHGHHGEISTGFQKCGVAALALPRMGRLCLLPEF